MARIEPDALLSIFEASLDETRVKQATEALRELQGVPGFCSVVLNVAANGSVKSDLRKAAGVALRGRIIRFWERDEDSGVVMPPEEKAAVRQQLLQAISLIDDVKTHDQITNALAFIACIEYPKVWPDLFENLVKMAQETRDPAVRLRILAALHEASAEIMHKPKDYQGDQDDRYHAARAQVTHLKNEAVRVFMLVAPLWLDSHNQLLQIFAQYFNGQIKDTDLDHVQALLIGKTCLSAEQLAQFFERIHFFLSNTVDCLRALGTRTTSTLSQVLADIMVYMMRFAVDTAETFPLTFVPSLERFLTFCDKQYFSEWPSQLEEAQETFLVQCTHLLAHCLYSRFYSEPYKELLRLHDEARASEPLTEAYVNEGYRIVTQFFTKEKLFAYVRIIVGRYLLMPSYLLELWENDAEDFIFEEISDHYTSKIYPASAHLLHRIFRFDSKVTLEMGRFILLTLAECGKVQPPTLDSIRLKDAAYNAIGIGAPVFSPEDIQLDRVIKEYCRSEFSDAMRKQPFTRILRRRAALVVMEWARDLPAKHSDLEKCAYEICLDCLMPQEDLVVRVSGAIAMKNMLQDFKFEAGRFLELLGRAVRGVVALIGEMSESATMTYILNIIADLVDAMGEHIRPYMEDIVNIVSELWNSSDDYHVQERVIKILECLVSGLIGVAVELEKRLRPLIDECVDVNKDLHRMLAPEALKLWSVMVMQTPQVSTEMLQLFHRLPPLLHLNADDTYMLRDSIHLMTAYILSGKLSFLKMHAPTLVECIDFVLAHSPRPRDVGEALELTSFLVLLFPDRAEGLKRLFRRAYIILLRRRELKKLDDAFTASCELLARLSLMNMPVFQSLLAELSAESHRNVFIDIVAAMTSDLRTDDDRKQFWSIPHARVVGLALTQFMNVDAGNEFIQLIPNIVNSAVLLISHWETKSDLAERRRNKYKRKCRMLHQSPAERKWEEHWNKDPLMQGQDFNPVARFLQQFKLLSSRFPGTDFMEKLFEALDTSTLNWIQDVNQRK